MTYNNYQDYCLDSSWTLWDFTNFATDFSKISVLSINFTLFLNNSYFSPLFPQWGRKYMNKRWIWTICWVSWKYLFKVPKPRYPSDTNSRDKESLNSSTQAKPSPAWRAAWGAAQARCRSAALPSDYITIPVALVQHCIVAEGQHRGAASAAGKLRSISLVCRLHNTITLHLTAVSYLSNPSWRYPSQRYLSIYTFFIVFYSNNIWT